VDPSEGKILLAHFYVKGTEMLTPNQQLFYDTECITFKIEIN